MDPDEWRYFLAGPTGQFDIPANPTDWLGDLEFNEMYKQLAGASKLEKLAGIEKFFVEHNKEFQVIFDSAEPQNIPLPGDWEGKLDYFQKMIILKAVRPDKISLAVQNYVTMKIGK